MITIPTLKEIYDDLISSVETELGVTIPLIGKNVIRVFCAVQAAKLKLMYLMIAKTQKNIFVDTAESVAIGGTLERFGVVKLGRSPFPAVSGQYTVTVTGTIGAVIPAQTTFKSDDSSTNPGFLYILDNAYTLISASDSITLRALTAGLDSELSVNDTLSATSPIANVNKSAVVTAISVDPLAAETIEDYRALALQAFRLEPQGGAPSDYRIWASDAQGVATVYPYAKPGDDGIIDLYVEATLADSTDGKGTPSASILDDVEEVIELDPDTTLPINERGRRPLGVFEINYLPVSVVEIDVTITGGSFTAAQQTTIETALKALAANVRPFIAGADIVSDQNDVINTNKVIFEIQNAIPSASFTSVSLEFDSAALSTYTFDNGEIPWIESITYV